MDRKCFLDTSGLYIYLDANDFRQSESSSLVQTAPVRITHNYVLAELVALCHARRVNRSYALEFVESLLDDPDVRIIWAGQHETREGMQFLRDRPDKTYSLCDAVSFLIMRQEGLTEALTSDRHFDQERFFASFLHN